MKHFDTKDIRNFALVGHGGSGKTSLGEAMLFCAKQTTRLGRTDDATSTLDTEPEEAKRKITIHAALGWCEWNRGKINFIDTPGDASFHTDMRLALTAVDAAVLVVSAPDGVQVGTEKAWSAAEDMGLPVAIFINKMDRERATFEKTLAECRSQLSERATPLQIPIGCEAGFEGVIDLLSLKAWRFPGDGREPQSSDVPDALKEQAQSARETLIEAVASTDDKLIEKYLETGELSEDEVREGLARGIVARNLIPVLCGAASRSIGIQPLMDFACDRFPSPLIRPPQRGVDSKGNEIERNANAAEPFSGVIFKSTGADIGRINLMRVVSGVLKSDSTVANSTRNSKERIGQIYALLGKKRESIPEAVAGDLVALAKLKETRTGDTLCDDKAPITFAAPKPPHPVISFAIRPKSQGDEDKVAAKLAEILEEDFGLQIVHDQASKEILLSGMGQSHIEVTVDKLRRLGVDVELLPPKVPYRETIKGVAKEVEGKHKKQTGGRGQYGVCYIDLEPLPRGTGFEYVDEIFGGAIPRQFIPAVEKGIRNRLPKGVVAGYPVVDVRVRLKDGKYHDVDSDNRSFEIAGSRGFQAAFRQAKPVLLEPVMNLEVVCPSDHAGDVMGNVNQKRGRVLGMDSIGKNTVIRAQVPMVETLRYEAELRSVTGGRGSFSIEFSHYDEVPGHLADRIISEAKVAAEEED